MKGISYLGTLIVSQGHSFDCLGTVSTCHVISIQPPLSTNAEPQESKKLQGCLARDHGRVRLRRVQEEDSSRSGHLDKSPVPL